MLDHGLDAPSLRAGPDADSSESGAAGDYPYALEARVGLYIGWLGIILVALPWAFSLVTASWNSSPNGTALVQSLVPRTWCTRVFG